MKILIIEDEPQIAAELKGQIQRIIPAARVTETLGSIKSAVAYLSDPINTTDLIFMDIHLSDGLSFEIFSEVPVSCPVIFCTAYDQYTLQAFKSNGIEYMLKPIRDEDIRQAFDKIEKLKKSLTSDHNLMRDLMNAFTGKRNYKTTILVQYKEGYIPLPVDNVAFYNLTNEVVYAHCFDNKRYPVFKSMEELESVHNPTQFYRINRQILLNRRAIKEIQSFVNRKVVVKTEPLTKELLIVSRLKVSTFLNWIEQP